MTCIFDSAQYQPGGDTEPDLMGGMVYVEQDVWRSVRAWFFRRRRKRAQAETRTRYPSLGDTECSCGTYTMTGPINGELVSGEE